MRWMAVGVVVWIASAEPSPVAGGQGPHQGNPKPAVGRAALPSKSLRLVDYPMFPAPFDYQIWNQLAAARERARRAGGRVLIGHIDTGHIESHAALPAHLRRRDGANFVEPISAGRCQPALDTRGLGRGHGTSTASVLAGPVLHVYDACSGRLLHSGWIGCAPQADVLPIRSHSFTAAVVPAASDRYAAAIRYAVRQGCEVISMSQGGLPSPALKKAVREAYDAGIAMFCATGNHQTILWTLNTPRRVVWPAAYPGVTPVCGITAEGKGYGRWPNPLSLLMPMFQRGNYGPRTIMGERAIAAFTPNIPCADPRQPDRLKYGSGTSLATPQVAAAAALYIAVHRNNRLPKGGWQKAETIYQALYRSAAEDRIVLAKWDAGSPRPTRWTDERARIAPHADQTLHLGRGVLQALDAIENYPPSKLLGSLKRQGDVADDDPYFLATNLISMLLPHAAAVWAVEKLEGKEALYAKRMRVDRSARNEAAIAAAQVAARNKAGQRLWVDWQAATKSEERDRCVAEFGEVVYEDADTPRDLSRWLRGGLGHYRATSD